MKNTPPRIPVRERETSDLVEDLCIALRNVGCGDYRLPNDERVIAFIHEVQQVSAELGARGVNSNDRIQRLSTETSWQMQTLLEECLAFPSVVPYVKEVDNVRRAFRCPICRQREFPDREGISLCNRCLESARAAILSTTPTEGLVLFRTYNKSKRCVHADSDTVLMTFEDEYDFDMGNCYCERCLLAEQNRRRP